MANTFQPFGFRSFGRIDGAAPTMGLTKCTINSSDANTYFTGDVVSIVTGVLGLPSSGSVTGNPVFGIFAGCEQYNPTVGRVVWSAQSGGNLTSSAPGFAYVITDPSHLFIAQGSTNAVLGSSVIGFNIGFASTSQSGGNTTTGQSVEFLASSTPANTATLPFKIVDLYQNYAPPGQNGTSSGSEAAQILVVKLNYAEFNTTTGSST